MLGQTWPAHVSLSARPLPCLAKVHPDLVLVGHRDPHHGCLAMCWARVPWLSASRLVLGPQVIHTRSRGSGLCVLSGRGWLVHSGGAARWHSYHCVRGFASFRLACTLNLVLHPRTWVANSVALSCEPEGGGARARTRHRRIESVSRNGPSSLGPEGQRALCSPGGLWRHGALQPDLLAAGILSRSKLCRDRSFP